MNKWVVLLALAAVVVSVGLGVFLMSRSSIDEAKRTEARETVWRFNGEVYEDFLDTYDNLIGFQPHLSMDKEVTVLYPFTQRALTSLNEMVERARNQYDNLSQIDSRKVFTKEEQKIYKLIKSDVEETLRVTGANLVVLSDFYDAFILPFMTATESGSADLRCTKTPAMTVLLQSENQNIVTAAEQYYELYCMAVQSNIDFSTTNAVQKMQNLTYDKALKAAQSLGTCLTAASQAQTSENNIQLLLEEISK